MRSNISDADISISEVGTELLGLHPLSSGEATAESEVDVAVATVPALFSCINDDVDC